MMQFDIQQETAVHTKSKNALVLAGAGSGKTLTLVERLAFLIETRRVSPHEIIAFTFTRKAAGEMQRRLQERIGFDARKVTMGTMHAIGLQFVHRFGDALGMSPKQVTVYSQWETDYLIRECALTHGIAKAKVNKKTGKVSHTFKPSKKSIMEAFNDFYGTGIAPRPDHPGHKIFSSFFARCRENNALTYGDLIIGMSLLMPTLAKHLYFSHILVDEVQDIDPLQWSIIEDMKRLFDAALFAVGDIDQSIYEFRGAVPGYLIDHAADFDIYRLETNYRSVPEIVLAANSLIGYNTDRLEKTMVPIRLQEVEREVPGPAVGCLYDVDSESIVGLLAAWPGNREEVAVLCRAHGPLMKLSRLLEEADIPHTYIGKKSALTNSEPFRRFHAFLKLTVNPYDNFSFLLIKDLIGLSDYSRSPTDTTFPCIRASAALEGKSHFQAWIDSNDQPVLVYEIGRDIFSMDDLGILSTLCSGDEYAPTIEFVKDWKENATMGEDTIEHYLDWLATYDLQEEVKDNQGLQLMTIHAAKGLEWPTVIVAGVNETMLPSSQAIKNDEVEQERRLAYVAWTRAEDQLVLTVRPEVSKNDYGKVSESPISRFIGESKIG